MAGKAKVFFAVACPKHGKEIGGTNEKLVLVGSPGSKRKRKSGGCPICKSHPEEVSK